jgi:hypothetical protein
MFWKPGWVRISSQLCCFVAWLQHSNFSFQEAKINTAPETQAIYGLANYPEFEYLLKHEFNPVIMAE